MIFDNNAIVTTLIKFNIFPLMNQFLFAISTLHSGGRFDINYTPCSVLLGAACASPLVANMRGWRNTVGIVLFEISNSMKPYPPVLYADTGQLKPIIVFLSHNNSVRFPTVFCQPLSIAEADLTSNTSPAVFCWALSCASPLVANSWVCP